MAYVSYGLSRDCFADPRRHYTGVSGGGGRWPQRMCWPAHALHRPPVDRAHNYPDRPCFGRGARQILRYPMVAGRDVSVRVLARTHTRSRARINYACMRVQTHSYERIRTEARTNVRTNALTYYKWMHARMYTYTRAHAHMHANIYSQDIVTFRRTIVLVVLFSQYLRDLKIPIGKQKSFYLFKLFPVSDNTIV